MFVLVFTALYSRDLYQSLSIPCVTLY